MRSKYTFLINEYGEEKVKYSCMAEDEDDAYETAYGEFPYAKSVELMK